MIEVLSKSGQKVTGETSMPVEIRSKEVATLVADMLQTPVSSLRDALTLRLKALEVKKLDQKAVSALSDAEIAINTPEQQALEEAVAQLELLADELRAENGPFITPDDLQAEKARLSQISANLHYDTNFNKSVEVAAGYTCFDPQRQQLLAKKLEAYAQSEKASREFRQSLNAMYPNPYEGDSHIEMSAADRAGSDYHVRTHHIPYRPNMERIEEIAGIVKADLAMLQDCLAL